MCELATVSKRKSNYCKLKLVKIFLISYRFTININYYEKVKSRNIEYCW